MNDPDVKLLFWLVVLGGIAATGWYFRGALMPERTVPVVELPAAEAAPKAERTGPLHPISTPEPAAEADRSLLPLPPLDNSDAYFLLDIGAIFGSNIESLLLQEAVIDRLVATVDNLPRDRVSEQIRPVRRLTEKFAVADGSGTSGSTVLGEESFRRYDALVRHIAAADIDAIFDLYRRYYSLFQQSFERLGYPNAYFNDRFVEVIDHLLATPDPNEPLILTRPNVLYEFSDPELERLSSGQKLLLRMGTEHAAIVKEVLRTLRLRIVRSQVNG